jgi:hypothetical protein
VRANVSGRVSVTAAMHPVSASSPLSARTRLLVALVLLGAPFVAFPSDFIPKALLDGGDDVLANLPQLVYSATKLLQGEILWAPELWMGHPILAEPEFATFYVPKLLLLLGPPMVTYAAYLVLHYVAAEASAFFYLRHLGIGPLGAVFGALAYAYAGFMLGHRAHTMYVCAGAWAPLVLLLFDRATEQPKASTVLGAALAFAMVPLCGAVQLTVYLGGLIVLLAALRAGFERRARPLAGVTCLLPALLLSALQLVPSYDFSRQLATSMRSDYALGVMHSFHPALLPTLGVPVAPLDAEVYSRAGVAVLSAVVVAVAGVRFAPPAIRAWAVVAPVALLLMFGDHVPPLARLLHDLPVVGVLRGPARHNFELGLSLSVLGAYGIERAARVGSWRVGRWIGAGMAFALLTVLAVEAVDRGVAGDAASRALLGSITPVTALGAVLAFTVWVAAVALRTHRRGVLAWAAIAVLPAVETAWAMRVVARPNRSALGQLDIARGALPEPGERVRLLSVSLHRGSMDALAGNSVLFHEGVESLQGYSSIVYRDAREILGLDMHGQPSDYHGLAYSVLPSVFGVTHLVLPSTACGDTRFSLVSSQGLCAREDILGATRPHAALRLTAGQLACTALAADTTWAYRLEMAARTQETGSKDILGASLSFLEPSRWTPRFGVEIPGPWLASGAARRTEAIRLADAESWGALMLENRRTAPLELFDMGLFVERDAAASAFGPFDMDALAAVSVEAFGEALRFLPGPDIARAERPARWPGGAASSGEAVLEVEARAPSGHAGDLVVDLYTDDKDGSDAELVVPGGQLRSAWQVFRRVIQVGGAPRAFTLRVRSAGQDPIDVRDVRLATRQDERVYSVPVATYRHRPDVRIENDRVTLAPRARHGGATHLPVRAFEVLLDATADASLDHAVTLGLDAPTRHDLPRTWEIERDTLASRARVRRVAVLPPDLRDPLLFVRVEGNDSLSVRELSATDACTVRGYRNPRRLANGLFLYENPRATPRAYTVGHTLHGTDPAPIRRMLLDLDPAELGRTAIVGEDVPAGLRPGAIEKSRFETRSSEIVVRSDGGPTLLVVNERFDPDWRATVDGRPTRILRVNGLVRGVVVPAGRHLVRLEYATPTAVYVGAGLALGGVLAAVLLGLALEWFDRRRSSPEGSSGAQRASQKSV